MRDPNENDPDRNGTEDPGSTPAEHAAILRHEVDAHHHQHLKG